MNIIDISLAIIALYCISVGCYLIFEKLDISIKLERRSKIESLEQIKFQESKENSIMGKANGLIRLDATGCDTKRQTNQTERKEITFASQQQNGSNNTNEPTPVIKSARIPDEQLDETFEDPTYNIDVNIDYKETELTEKELSDEDIYDDELSQMGYDAAQQATGVELPELQEAVKIATDHNSTISKRREAGEVFYKLEGSDMLEKILNIDSNTHRAVAAILLRREREYNARVMKESQMNDHNRSLEFDINDYL